MTVVPVDPRNEASVLTLLERAGEWLSTAVARSEPIEHIANVKAQVATAAEATKQLSLSKEIQLDAQEMVRRAEYALAKAIRKGQEEGSVATENNDYGRRAVHGTALASPTDFAKDVELYDRPSQGKAGILSIADNATPEQFDAALAEAKAEGNLSRANVSRKVKPEPEKPARYLSANTRAEQIAKLADQGATSEQIARSLDLGLEYVQKVARDHKITIRADVVRGKVRRLDSNRILSGTAQAVSAAAFSIQQIDPLDLDQDAAQEWVDSLTDSLKALSKAIRKIKESLHE